MSIRLHFFRLFIFAYVHGSIVATVTNTVCRSCAPMRAKARIKKEKKLKDSTLKQRHEMKLGLESTVTQTWWTSLSLVPTAVVLFRYFDRKLWWANKGFHCFVSSSSCFSWQSFYMQTLIYCCVCCWCSPNLVKRQYNEFCWH